MNFIKLLEIVNARIDTFLSIHLVINSSRAELASSGKFTSSMSGRRMYTLKMNVELVANRRMKGLKEDRLRLSDSCLVIQSGVLV